MNKIIFVVVSILLIGAGIFLLVGSEKESEENFVLTGEVVLTEDILLEFSEEVLIEVVDNIDNYTNYYREFQLNESCKVFVDVSLNSPVDYVFLPESELKNYVQGNLSLFYPVLKDNLIINEEYQLDSGEYVIVLVTSELPVEAEILVKSETLKS